MPVAWPDDVDQILSGDLTAGVAWTTPAGGCVITAVAPCGLRDRDAGTVTFTTSLGFGKKLNRIRTDPRVSLCYHAREHGHASGTQLVLVQGTAEIVEQPDRDWLENVLTPAATEHLGAPRRGFFWDRWLQEYYADRVPVHVTIERVVAWPDLAGAGEPRVFGAPLPEAAPAPQDPPKNGTGPRVDAAKSAARQRSLPHRLLTFRSADGYPLAVPYEVGEVSERGIAIRAHGLPPGGRRAGVIAHAYRPKLIGLKTIQHTGWLEVAEDGSAVYAPHSQTGFTAPPNKTLLLLFNGGMAKRGLRKARKAAAARA
jgi:hypothetical protein